MRLPVRGWVGVTVAVTRDNPWFLCLVSLTKPWISIPIWTCSWGGKPCCFSKMWQKKKKKGSSNLTCLECISRLKFLTGIREAVESSPALREFHPSLWTSHSLSWPQVLWKWALCVDSLTLFADKSQLQSGRATGKQNCALTPSPHSWAFIPTWTCFSIPPHLKHNYSFHQPLFICALPSQSCLFLGTCFECRKAKKPHYFICDFSLKSELKWEFLNGISWE